MYVDCHWLYFLFFFCWWFCSGIQWGDVDGKELHASRTWTLTFDCSTCIKYNAAFRILGAFRVGYSLILNWRFLIRQEEE